MKAFKLKYSAIAKGIDLMASLGESLHSFFGRRQAGLIATVLLYFTAFNGILDAPSRCGLGAIAVLVMLGILSLSISQERWRLLCFVVLGVTNGALLAGLVYPPLFEGMIISSAVWMLLLLVTACRIRWACTTAWSGFLVLQGAIQSLTSERAIETISQNMPLAFLVLLIMGYSIAGFACQEPRSALKSEARGQRDSES